MGKKNIFLIGFMGAGKSSIAQQLHRKLGYPVIEMDERIVKEQGMSINDIFAKFGEDAFRDMETDLIKTIGMEGPSIISCGGGVVVRPQNVECMKNSGIIVYLTAEPETIYERVRHSTDRPILNGHMNVEYIAQLMEKRSTLYEDAADLKVATDGKSYSQICEEILAGM